MGLMSLLNFRRSIYAIFGTLVLVTLWVTSLTLLSAQPTATALLTDAGAQVLNPFLVAHQTGVSQSTYASLERDARAHPSQPLALSVFKVRVLGSEIVGRGYDDAVRIIYSHVATMYYAGGAGAVFTLPSDLQKLLPSSSYGLFPSTGASSSQLVPGVPIPAQLPGLLQPFFTVTGFTPDSLTDAGHQRIAGLLPWFWLATLVLGGLTLLLNRDEKRLSSLAASVAHGAWPVILVLGAAWIFSLLNPTAFAPFRGAYGLVAGAFLPIYGAAFALGLAGWVVTKILSARNPQPASSATAAKALPPELARVLASAGMPPAAFPASPASPAAGMPEAPPLTQAPPVGGFPETSGGTPPSS
jgi:hypothetical protein